MIQRIYRHKIVSRLTLSEIEKIIETDDINYSGDYGLKNDDNQTRLIFSVN